MCGLPNGTGLTAAHGLCNRSPSRYGTTKDTVIDGITKASHASFGIAITPLNPPDLGVCVHLEQSVDSFRAGIFP